MTPRTHPITDKQGLIERLDEQVERGMFGVEKPITFAECLDALTTQAVELERLRAAGMAISAWFNDENGVDALNEALAIFDALTPTKEQGS